MLLLYHILYMFIYIDISIYVHIYILNILEFHETPAAAAAVFIFSVTRPKETPRSPHPPLILWAMSSHTGGWWRLLPTSAALTEGLPRLPLGRDTHVTRYRGSVTKKLVEINLVLQPCNNMLYVSFRWCRFSRSVVWTVSRMDLNIWSFAW